MALIISCACGRETHVPKSYVDNSEICPGCGRPLHLRDVTDGDESLADDRTSPTRSCPICRKQTTSAAVRCGYCELKFSNYEDEEWNDYHAELLREYHDLKANRKREGRKSILMGVPGLMLLIAGFLLAEMARKDPAIAQLGNWNSLPMLVGRVLFFAGLGAAARYKGRSAAWGLLALLSCIGLFVFIALKDLVLARLKEIEKTLAYAGHRV